MSRRQLLAAGLHPQAVKHRIAKGRLHPVWRGVYAVGRPQLTQRGWWMAAVLACGARAALSHESAAVLWGLVPTRWTSAEAQTELRDAPGSPIHVSVPAGSRPRRKGIHLHRCERLDASDLTQSEGIPVTSPGRTLIDLGTRLTPGQLEAAVNQADKLDWIDPDGLRSLVESRAGLRGVAALRRILDRRTFSLTDSELEREFLRLVRRAGLPPPQTGHRVNGFRVDFHWPEVGLVVETDGLRYHRTPAQQARDRRRDQAHAAAGLTPLRFTHAQVRFERDRVAKTLVAVWRRLQRVA